MPAHKRHRTQKDMTASPNKYPQGFFKDKDCKWCKVVFKPQAPSHQYCTEDCASKAMTDNYLRNSYGISYEDFHKMFEEQNGKCKICRKAGFPLVSGQKIYLNVDHCHTTGAVRGLLCHNCNRALGLLQDDIAILKSAVEYLEGATTIPQGSTLK